MVMVREKIDNNNMIIMYYSAGAGGELSDTFCADGGGDGRAGGAV